MMSWLEQRFPIKRFLNQHLFSYMVPSTLNFWYVFGLLALLFVMGQFISGFCLVMFYVPSITEAFNSIQQIMREIPAGWFIRYMHTTGASFIFLVLYLHMFRGFLYSSYKAPREFVWVLGVLLYLLMLLEAFLGYVLPWGQMSYWGAEVLTSALEGIPYIGHGLKLWVRGAEEVGQPLLQRFYAFHIIALPFMLFIFIKLHVIAIRCVGSSEPIELDIPSPKIPFYPNHVIKELLPLVVVLLLFFLVLFFFPQGGGIVIESLNYVPANPLQTPASIHPPWYIGPFFTILRSLPHLGLGLLMTFIGLILICFLPVLDRSKSRLLLAKPLKFKLMFSLFCVNFLYMGYLSWHELTPLGLYLSRASCGIYFAFYLLLPWLSRETKNAL
ncbi:MAG: cytochrome bc complex cytochrome b subunit [Gammaproteobacteria bacterium]|nr:cytochrome bc complex cytochrome b subunit [Gammaproteobacteria bacterium]